MTTVRFYRCRKDGALVGVSACGHSGYAAEGSDIVCAAVTLAISMAEDYLRTLAGAGVTVRMNEKPEISVSVASKNPAIRRQCSAFLESVRRVLEGSVREYGEFIQIRDCPFGGLLKKL